MNPRIRDLASAGVFAAVGLIFVVTGRELPLASRGIPGPGLFPLMLAAITIVLAVLLAINTVRTPRPAAVREGAPSSATADLLAELGPTTEFEDADAEPSRTRPLIVWLAILGSALLLPVLGFLLATMLLMAVIILGVERRRDVVSLITIVALPVACYELFAVLLEVRLPTGLFG